ncbi:MAG: hypothetical protein ACRDSR_11955 [Pseudonocardiaceae bacterium]
MAADTGSDVQHASRGQVGIAGVEAHRPGDRLTVDRDEAVEQIQDAVTHKLRVPLPAQRAASAVRAMAKLDVVQVDVPLMFAAMDTSRTAKISLWNALVIESARQAGCRRILTEDLSHGQVIRDVVVENPFQPDPTGPD